MKDENGNDLPIGPMTYMDNPEVPQANAYMLEAATNAVKEVSQLGVDSDAANGQVAFDTVNQLNMRADLSTYVFQDNLATAMRRDGEIYASMVNESTTFSQGHEHSPTHRKVLSLCLSIAPDGRGVV